MHSYSGIDPTAALKKLRFILSDESDPEHTITDADYADDKAFLLNIPTQAESQLHSLEETTVDIGLHVNVDKTEYICFNQKGDISTLNGVSLKLANYFTYLLSSVSSTENDNIQLAKVWTAIDRLYGSQTYPTHTHTHTHSHTHTYIYIYIYIVLYSLYNGLALLHKYTSTRASDGVHQSAWYNHVWYHLRSRRIVTLDSQLPIN